MPLQKQSFPINFSQGLDTKSDPKQVQFGKFLALKNTVFDKAGALTKRNGFANITKLPNATQTTLTTLNDNLLATGSNLYAYSADTNQWLDQGIIQPVRLETQSLVRNSTSQQAPDTAVSSAGLCCLTYVDAGLAYYQISDSNTGQQVVSRQALPATAKNPRAFVLSRYFVITFIATVAATPHLQYVAIPISDPTNPGIATDISTVVESLTAGYDGVVANNNLYIGWSSTASQILVSYITSTLLVAAPFTMTSHRADLMSLSADLSGSSPNIWVSFWDTNTDDGFTAAYSATLLQLLAPTQVITNQTINELTSSVQDGLNTILYEVQNTYGYSPNAKTDYIEKVTCDDAGTVSSPDIILRSVGLASKAFIHTDTGVIYMLATYGETNQPSYFLIDANGDIYMRLAYSNGGGYKPSQVLPTVSFVEDQYLIPYERKDLLTTINKTTDPGKPTNAIYTQTGIELAKFAINVTGQYSSEIASVLHLTGGQLWMYDGVRPVEHGFHVWAENITATTATTGGFLGAQQYNYVFCYEWTDNQGNLYRSAPSIPVAITTTGTTSANTINVPTLRLTYKTAPNPVRLVGYRWSVAQPVYYQFTSIPSPVINNPAIDSIAVADTLADSSILGNAILYTTGGVVENIAAPASIASALFKNRLFLVDAEDPNLIWFSKVVIQAVPVEMSDLLTIYVAPTSGAQGSTGPISALSAMDDKLIVFKRDAIYYITGTGPDNTGANNDFSDPIFITSSVGCTNPNSIVLMPNGIMFQSDKGIWLLGRDLSTTYIGAPVEVYNNFLVRSAKSIPATNQVRFVLEGDITLMYDYYYQQWGTFSNLQAISSTLYQSKDTYLNVYGNVYQETANTFVDGSRPVLMSFTTSWANVAGVQGYERFYQAYLLGSYYTPFTLSVQLAYDYNPSSQQTTTIRPDNYSPAWGGDAQWGSNESWGGRSNVFEARLFPQVQKCESFQITVEEVYDPSLGVAAGQGLSLSGMNLVVGLKKGYRTQKASQSFG